MVPWHHAAVNGVSGEVLGGRLALRRRLGAGAFGTVYEAVDTKFGGRVAVKVLAREQSHAILRFKREFRSLADVVHPNLVRLYELVVDDNAHYFSMELVEGSDFLSHVSHTPGLRAATTVDFVPGTASSRPAAPPSPSPPRKTRAADSAKLRDAFLQLARGVQAIHDAGKLHCDLKPSNVLVTPDGRVVILDFGLIADLQGVDERHRGGMGTPGYAAPEQTRGAALTRAADWYAVGVMMHEALTGELPHRGDALGDGELATLARALTATAPEARPTGPQVLERLGDTPRSMSAPARNRLFGREKELSALRDAWRATEEGAAVLVRVIGASGIGKTSLVDTFLDELPSDRLVLRGRCYEQESVPYKALDSVVDALAQHLQRLGPAAAPMVPAYAGLLGRLFPVLRDTFRSSEAEHGLEFHELRRRAFHALRELLEAVARENPIVVFLDDVQWGDVDSARLLTDLLRPPNAPHVLTIIGHRPDAGEGTPFLSTLEATGLTRDARSITVSELGERDALALAGHLLVGRSDAGARTIWNEAAGNPLFIQQLAVRTNEHGDAHGELGLADVILSRVRELDAPARQLVETVALAGQPIEEHVALRAASLDAAAALDATFAIRHARLVTARARGDAIVLEPAHDRVRETVVTSLEANRKRDGHKNIAEALLTLSHPDPERLVHHFRGAGDNERTRQFAVLAADRADEAFAFERAASFRGLVLDLTKEAPDRWELHEKHAVSLANAGRAIDAADAYERAANALETSGAHADKVTKLHIHRREAGGLTLRSGRLELGFQRMDRVLADVGVTLPRSRGTATMLSAARRAKLLLRGLKIRPDAVTTPAARFRLDAIWSVATGIIQLNQTVGDALIVQYLLEALEAGDRSAVARGLAFEQVYHDIIGGFLAGRGVRLRDEMDKLVEQTGDPFDRAWTLSSKGGSAWFRSDWQECWDHNEASLKIFREQVRGATWEMALCQAYRLPALAYLGDMKRLCEIVPSALAVARERGDLFAVNTLRLGMQSLTLLVEDQPEEAIAEADAAIKPFPRTPYIGPHYHHLFAVMQADLYRGQVEKAWDAIEAGWRDIEGAQLTMVQTLRIEVRHLRSRAAIALARSDKKRARSLLSVAEADAAKIAKDKVALAAPFSSLLRAGIAGSRGRNDDAVKELRAACVGLERSKMAMYLHATKDRLGQLVGGTEGAKLRDEAAEWMKDQGIVNPARMIGMLVPGV